MQMNLGINFYPLMGGRLYENDRIYNVRVFVHVSTADARIETITCRGVYYRRGRETLSVN